MGALELFIIIITTQHSNIHLPPPDNNPKAPIKHQHLSKTCFAENNNNKTKTKQQNQQQNNNNNTATDEKPALAKVPKRTIKGAVRELFAPATPREDRSEERRVEQPAVTQSARGVRQYQSKEREMGNWRTNSPQPEDNDDTERNDDTGRPLSASSLL